MSNTGGLIDLNAIENQNSSSSDIDSSSNYSSDLDDRIPTNITSDAGLSNLMSQEVPTEVLKTSLRDWFTHPDSSNREKRNSAYKKSLLMVCGSILMVTIIFVISCVMYFGSAWKPTTANMDVVIIQSDPGVLIAPNTTINLGELIVSGLTGEEDSDGRKWADWEVRRSYGSPKYQKVIDDELLDEEIYGVIQIPENFTQIYITAMLGFLPDYPIGPTYDNTVYAAVNSGQHPPSIRVLISLLTALFVGINESSAKLAASGAIGGFSFDLNAANVNATISPLSYEIEQFNTVPIGTNFCIAMGLVFMWSSANALVGSTFAWSESPDIVECLSDGHLFLLRWASFIFNGFWLALAFTTILAGFNTGFSEGFGVTWMFCWLVIETFMAMLIFLNRALGTIGAALMAILMVLQITLGSTFVDVVMLTDFYSWGIPFPWTHAYQGFRTTIIGSPECCGQLGVNIGVLFAWMTVFTIAAGISWYKRVSDRDWNDPNSGTGRFLTGLTSGGTTNSVMGGAGG